MTPTSIILLLELFTGQTVDAVVGTARGNAMMQLINDGLVTAEGGGPFKLTDRGYCYVTAIASIPLPNLKWVMPPLRFE